jgi:hypothetical protein
MNALSTTAAAVKSALSTAPFGQSFKLVRCFAVPEYATMATNELRVLVIAFEEEPDIHGPNTTKKQCDHTYGVKVAIVKRVDAADVTSEAALPELDALSDFREAVIDFLKNNRVMGDATLDALKNSPAYDPPTLDKNKTYVSVIALTYRQLR